ncbi:hypothetical protein NKJ72_12070 [Mesorhizobium sp. M0045]|uniref:hypothetical protein n=1 Tax=Mesorhizobium sp. M0045 TaxID=2956857 RepID=UPI0033376CCC
MTTFRVHFADASHRDVPAATPAEAAKKVRETSDVIITKVKVLKQERAVAHG